MQPVKIAGDSVASYVDCGRRNFSYGCHCGVFTNHASCWEFNWIGFKVCL